MKLETFFEKFELFADAPDAVGKMRELVLQLAVQGRLVEQDPNDESVEELLTKNDARRMETVKKDHRADQENQPLLSAEDRWDIADTWSWRALADLVLFVDYRGKTPVKISSGVRLLTAKNVRKGRITLSPEEFLSSSDYKQWMTRGIPKSGDVLFTTEAPMGNAAVVELQERFALAQRVICFQTYGALDPAFLVMQILSDQFQFILEKNATGVTAKGIKAAKLKQLPIAIPPLVEQKRIVAKVDELMALCDRLEAQQKERQTRHSALARASLARFADAPTPANLDFLFHKSHAISPAELRKAILTLAVRGKLVEQDPNDEPAEKAVARVPKTIRPARFDKRSTASIQGIAALSVGPTERIIPTGWVCVPLIDICRLESGHTPSRTRPDWWGGDVSWVGVVDARLHDGATIYETRQHTNAEGLANSAARMLPAGTVCVSRTASVGYVIILGKPMATSQDFVNWVPSKAVTSDWLRLVFSAEKDAFNRFSKGAVHQTIYYPEWLAMHTLLPPVAEQIRIVAKVDQLMALVDQLESKLTAACSTAEKLTAAIVAELTTHD